MLSAFASRASENTAINQAGTANIARVMTGAGVRRFVGVSASAIYSDRYDNLLIRLAKPILRRIFQTSYTDLQRMELFFSPREVLGADPKRITVPPFSGSHDELSTARSVSKELLDAIEQIARRCGPSLASISSPAAISARRRAVRIPSGRASGRAADSSRLTCTAAPIDDPASREIIGVPDVTVVSAITEAALEIEERLVTRQPSPDRSG